MTDRFSKDDITHLETTILDGRAHTFKSLCGIFGLVTDTQERQVDKVIQRLRKAGKIKLTRNGRTLYWTATPSQAVRAA